MPVNLILVKHNRDRKTGIQLVVGRVNLALIVQAELHRHVWNKRMSMVLKHVHIGLKDLLQLKETKEVAG